MKKIFSIALAVVMLFAICVPAFAANPITKDTEQTGSAIVKTKDTDKEGNDPTSYSVTIPADTTMFWGDTDAYDLSYTIDAHIKSTQRLTVSVTSANDGKMIDAATGLALAYTLTGTVNYEQPALTVLNGEVVALSANVATADWDSVPVAEYQDTLTFTVAIVEA